MVGAFALAQHGHLRATADIDFVVRATELGWYERDIRIAIVVAFIRNDQLGSVQALWPPSRGQQSALDEIRKCHRPAFELKSPGLSNTQVSVKHETEPRRRELSKLKRPRGHLSEPRA